MTTIQDITFNIMQGEYDDNLDLLSETIKNRRLSAMQSLKVGDTVRFNGNVSPKYLQGALATVSKVNTKSAQITLMEAQGRFGTRPMRAPFSIIEKVDR